MIRVAAALVITSVIDLPLFDWTVEKLVRGSVCVAVRTSVCPLSVMTAEPSTSPFPAFVRQAKAHLAHKVLPGSRVCCGHRLLPQMVTLRSANSLSNKIIPFRMLQAVV